MLISIQAEAGGGKNEPPPPPAPPNPDLHAGSKVLRNSIDESVFVFLSTRWYYWDYACIWNVNFDNFGGDIEIHA